MYSDLAVYTKLIYKITGVEEMVWYEPAPGRYETCYLDDQNLCCFGVFNDMLTLAFNPVLKEASNQEFDLSDPELIEKARAAWNDKHERTV